jgi:hypothetical protein
MATTKTLAQVVQEICDRLNDSDRIKYADSTTYLGRASVRFFDAIETILEKPKSFGMKPHDYRGLYIDSEIVIGQGVTEDGTILLSDLDNYSDLIEIYTNSDSDNDQLPFRVVKINSKYPDYAQYTEPYSMFYTPKVDSSADRGYYTTDTAIQFYPKEGTGNQEYYVTVKYVKEINPDDYDKTTEFYAGASGGLFSLRFIKKATDIATALLLEERNV